MAEDNPVQAGEVAIDPETGELVGWSATLGVDQVEYLTRICAEAQAVIKEHEQIHNAARKALEQLLVDRGERSIVTPYGTPALRSQNRRSGRPERVVNTVRRYELSRDQEQLIWMCATALDAKELDDLAQAGLLPLDAVEDLIEVKTTTFVQVTVPRGGGAPRPS